MNTLFAKHIGKYGGSEVKSSDILTYKKNK